MSPGDKPPQVWEGKVLTVIPGKHSRQRRVERFPVDVDGWGLKEVDEYSVFERKNIDISGFDFSLMFHLECVPTLSFNDTLKNEQSMSHPTR